MFVYEFWQWEEVISKTDCEAIIEKLFNTAESEPGQIIAPTEVTAKIQDIRVTDIVWSDNTEVSELASKFIHSANVASGWHINASILEKIQLGRYGVGGHYDWHADSFAPIDGIQRKLSFSLQLSDPDTYEGGDLLIGRSMPVAVTRKQGSIIVFPSCLFHKVTPITKGERYSAVTWMRGPQFR